MVVLGDLEQARPEASLENYKLIEHDLGHRKFRAVAAATARMGGPEKPKSAAWIAGM